MKFLSLPIFLIFVLFLFNIDIAWSKKQRTIIWTKTIWKGKRATTPLSTLRTCKEYFPEVQKKPGLDCSGTDGRIHFINENTSKVIAVQSFSHFCDDKTYYRYRIKEEETLSNVTRNKFCSFIVGLHKKCNKCLE